MNNKIPLHPWSKQGRGEHPLKIVYEGGENYITTVKIVSPLKYMNAIQPSATGKLPHAAYWVRNGIVDTEPCWLAN